VQGISGADGYTANNQGNRVTFQDQQNDLNDSNYNEASDHQPDEEVQDIVHALQDDMQGEHNLDVSPVEVIRKQNGLIRNKMSRLSDKASRDAPATYQGRVETTVQMSGNGASF
jgi:hypothetical protein